MISDPYFITYLIQWDISRALIYILAASPLASSGFAAIWVSGLRPLIDKSVFEVNIT